MKKYTIQEVAKLLSDKTHAIYCDVNEFELLRNILKLAFPKDEYTDSFDFKMYINYGFCLIEELEWNYSCSHYECLQIINLSDVLKENEMLINDIKVNDSMHVETVTISKEDYDSFLKLENKAKKSDQKFLDKCAISVMEIIIKDELNKRLSFTIEDVVECSFSTANSMLTERNKNK